MPLPAPSASATRICLSDTAYESVRAWILDGTLTPGEPIRDEALAQSLGMSRTPVREALRRLEEEGFVATTASRRFYVSEVSLRQALDSRLRSDRHVDGSFNNAVRGMQQPGSRSGGRTLRLNFKTHVSTVKPSQER